jgi:uncharacterized repeat protein (TIGR01451 family)
LISRAAAVASVAAGLLALAQPVRADHSIVPANASTIGTAIARDSSAVTGASFVPGTGLLEIANAAPSVALTSFPTHGSTYGILTSGDARFANHPGTFVSAGGSAPFQGANDVTILKVDVSVPAGQNCLSVDFQFLSEEYPDFVGGSFNDAFIAQLDRSDWSIGQDEEGNNVITAPGNFAFDPGGNVISVNSTGVASMSGPNGAGTAYDGGDPANLEDDDNGGATTLLRASTPVTAGAHSVYFSIFDQGDTAYDSAVFLDNLALGTTSEGACQPGATLPPPTVSKSAKSPTSSPGGTNTYTITVTNPNDAPVQIGSISDTLPAGFSYVAGSTRGDVIGDPAISGQTLTWSAIEGPLVIVPADGSRSLSFDVRVAAAPGTYLNDATATASGYTIQPTGPTAPIKVLAAPTVSKTADERSTPAGGTNGYTITLANPNDVAVSIDSVSDTLPAGFGYVAGSTSGAVTTNPTITGQTLRWAAVEGSLLMVPANGTRTIAFDATVATTPGEYFNEASATANGFTIQPTGPTAPVTVTASPAALPCDPITLEGTAAGESLVGSDAADRIRGLAGRDRIDGRGGNDHLCAGDGGDYGYGRDGVDTLLGEAGNDRLFGGREGDAIDGGPGYDAMIGGRGPDTFNAADGARDCIVTGRGDDTVSVDPGLDRVDPKDGCPAGFWL